MILVMPSIIFDWTKATDSQAFPENTKTRAFTKGLIALRKSTDAFNFKSKADVDARLTLLTVPGQDNVAQEDLVLGYQTVAFEWRPLPCLCQC